MFDRIEIVSREGNTKKRGERNRNKPKTLTRQMNGVLRKCFYRVIVGMEVKLAYQEGW